MIIYVAKNNIHLFWYIIDYKQDIGVVEWNGEWPHEVNTLTIKLFIDWLFLVLKVSYNAWEVAL